MRDAALRAITDAQTAARKARAAKLLCSAFARWARGSEAGAFVFWRGVSRTAFLIEDARTPRCAIIRSSSTTVVLKSQACAFVCWRSTTSELLLIDDRRRRAAARALRADAVSAGPNAAPRRVVGDRSDTCVEKMRRGERAAACVPRFASAHGAASTAGAYVWWRRGTRRARARRRARQPGDEAFRNRSSGACGV